MRSADDEIIIKRFGLNYTILWMCIARQTFHMITESSFKANLQAS